MRVWKWVTLSLLVLATATCRPGDERATAPGVVLDGAPPGEGFRSVVEQVLPAIVFIQAEAMPPPGLERLLPGIRELPQEPLPIGIGSGVLFTEDGYILTNNHVVQQAERVLVVLHDRRHFEARVVGRDPSTEVAVVRIEGSGFPVARLADSDALQLGDWVLAMGSPLGLEFSVTAGIVSGTGRALGILSAQMDPASEQAAPLEHFIQTDAALSPGNSGGPLVNTAGEVVGINTAVAMPRGAPAGYGFAIPSNLARQVADQLIHFGEVRRAYMGVGLANVTPRLAQEQGLRTVEGAAVTQVEPGSPAAQAGLEQADIILAIGDHRVVTVSDLQAALVQLEPGTRVRLRVVRQGRELEVPIELGVVRSGVAP